MKYRTNKALRTVRFKKTEQEIAQSRDVSHALLLWSSSDAFYLADVIQQRTKNFLFLDCLEMAQFDLHIEHELGAIHGGPE